MSTDIGVVRGLIELQDDFTGRLGLAEAALSNFSKENQQSLTAVAGVVGIVAAAFTAAAAAVYNLGQRGADVVDVAQTLQHFSGSAAAAEANLKALRDGVKGTVDDFGLMKDASHLLSAGVKLNAEDFGTLGSAAFVLQNRGLGGTKEMLELVSDAMVTGRTRALAMAIGVVDAGDAEAKYAETLGITKDQLTDTGKAEAKRIAIMEMLRTAVKDAGKQERDFGEEIEYAKTAVMNWVDEVAVAIASSPALAAGMKAIEQAVQAAFGSGTQDSIAKTMEYVKKGAVTAVDFGLAMVEMARVVNVVWSAIKAVVLTTEAAIVGVGAAVTTAIGAVLGAAAALPGATAGMKEMARSAQETGQYLRAMTTSLADEADQAALGISGNSDFDKTLDSLGGTLFTVRDAIDGAAASQAKGNEQTDIAAKNVATLAKMTADHNALMIDQQKIEDALWVVEKKSLEETTQLWNEYFNVRAHSSGTSMDAQRADIQRWFDDQVSKLDYLDKNYNLHYNALENLAGEKLKAIEVDWDSVKDKSFEALEQTYKKAQATYDAMVYSSLHFSRDAMEEQRVKVEAARDAMRGLGVEAVLAQNAAADAAAKHTAELAAQVEQMQKAALLNRQMGGSRTYDLSTKAGMDEFTKLNPMARFNGAIPKDYFKTHTIEDAIKSGLLDLYGGWNGPRMAGGGVSDGGMTMVGENGPEIVRMPAGAQVYPTGTGPGGGGGGISLVFHVNGTAQESARQIKQILMRELKSVHKFGSA